MTGLRDVFAFSGVSLLARSRSANWTAEAPRPAMVLYLLL